MVRMKTMTETTPPPVPAYGVRTCGKPAPGPLDFGPCRLDPDHDGGCQYEALGGTVTIEDMHQGNGRSPLDMVREIESMHRKMRRAFRVSMAATAVSIAACAYLVTDAMTRLFS